MSRLIKKAIERMLGMCGLAIARVEAAFPPDFTQEEIELIESALPFTVTDPERVYSLIHAVNYIVKNNIAGAMVECGVLKGGSIMTIVKTLVKLGCLDRDIYLFDTFEGMPKPSEKDISWRGEPAHVEYERATQDGAKWCRAGLDEVKKNVLGLGYDNTKFHFVKGMVEDTLPEQAPPCISLLRLDTDWYESTRHELIHLFPRLSVGGVLIIDDYGHYEGARKATDEYISQNNITFFLNRIDYTARVGVKLAENSSQVTATI